MKRKMFISLALFVLAVALVWESPQMNLSRAEAPASAPSLNSTNQPTMAASRKDRCGTKQIDESVAVEYEAALKNFNSGRNPAQVRKSGTVNIGVFFHVVNKGKGIANGDVPMKWLHDQIDVLNAAYAGADPTAAPTSANTPFRFSIIGVDRTTNAAWFNAGIDSAEEREMKTALHVGGPDVLNFYITNRWCLSGLGHFPILVCGRSDAGWSCSSVFELARWRLLRASCV